MDVEVSVNGGNVALGIFTQGDLLDMKEAERILTGIGEMIDGAF